MSDFGLNAEGFNLKREDDILSEQEEAYQSTFGENFTLDDRTPFGGLAGIQSGSFADLWELTQASFTMFSPSQSFGVFLDGLVELNGITRNEATRSTVTLRLGGDDNTLVEAGSIAEVQDTGERFRTLVDATIASGSVQVAAESVNTGPIAAAANTITVIVSSVTGWNTVDNLSAAQPGTNRETDEELRQRRKNSVAANATNTTDAIFAAVSDLDGTQDVVVLENDTNVVDGNGLQPKTFEVIVRGGDENQIAQAIWSKKPTGIQAAGSTTVQIPDSQGFLHAVSFTRPTEINIIVEVDITAFAGFPGDGEDQIKQNIVDYSNGVLVEGRGFSTGQDVIWSELYTPVNAVPNHSVTRLEIAKSGNPLAEDDLVIGIREVSLFTIGNITVQQ